jgi:Raf kinase inhibitor-like YbhB/YbcL family protein
MRASSPCRSVAVALALSAGAAADMAAASDEPRAGRFALATPSFAHLGAIPSRHTCEGGDASPELRWSGVPSGTKSFALVVDDPDAPDPAAPATTWVHWVLYDIPAGTASLAAGISAATLPAGTREGINDWRRTGYGGPCPPVGTHRYFHKLYALDVVLPDLHRPTKARLEAAMSGHILGRAEIVGTYRKTR